VSKELDDINPTQHKTTTFIYHYFLVMITLGWFMIRRYLMIFSAVILLVLAVNAYTGNGEIPFNITFNNGELASPFDHIPEDNIRVYSDRVVIYIDNPEWAAFEDTNSMDPIIDEGANAIQIVPESTQDIHVGDIISYESEYAEGTIIHRVVSIGNDDEGWYCIAKGDNNPDPDPGRIRFSQIKKVLVAVIY
jgi:signal peptidase I